MRSRTAKLLPSPWPAAKSFPDLMIDLLKIGEEEPAMSRRIAKPGEHLRERTIIALRVMTNLIEPAMIIVMAMGVGFCFSACSQRCRSRRISPDR